MFLLPLLNACSPVPAESDALRYTRLVSLSAPEESQLQECAELSNPQLRGDCGLAVAQRVAASHAQPPETFCPQITEPVWRSECFFVAAEFHNDQDNIETAAALCLQAALFTDHCSQHLWQRSLRTLTWHNGSQDFLEHLPDAQRLYDRWAPLLSSETDFPVRFWRRYYEGGFERARSIDLRACASLPQEARMRCRTAGCALFERQIEEIIRIPRAAEDLCASPPDADALSRSGPPQFNAHTDPDLNAVIARLQETHCQDGMPVDVPVPARDVPFTEAP